MAKERKNIARNKRARFDYEILERFEAGVVLTGTEVKSLRERNTQITESFIMIRGEEAWWHNVYIAPYSHGNRANVDPDRRRKLLLHKREIRYLHSKVKEQGFTIVPLDMYFDENGRVKVQIALARGKKLHDKRSSMAARDTQRDIDRALKERQRD